MVNETKSNGTPVSNTVGCSGGTTSYDGCKKSAADTAECRDKTLIERVCRCYCDDLCEKGMSGMCFHKHDDKGQIKQDFKYNGCYPLKMLRNSVKGTPSIEDIESAESRLLCCPFCGEAFSIGICDAEGNRRTEEYLDEPYSGLSFDIYHDSSDCPIGLADEPVTGGFYDLDKMVESMNKRYIGQYKK